MQREETRRDLAIAAFELACTEGVANVLVPEIAAAVGVSTRTFNNYFPSKEAAIAWPAHRRAAELAESLLARPAQEPLSEALIAAVRDVYWALRQDGESARWLRRFRVLVASDPVLQGEYLKVAYAGEQALAGAIAVRIGADRDELRSKVLAAVVVGAERAAVMHWIKQDKKQQSLRETVRQAVRLALALWEVD